MPPTAPGELIDGGSPATPDAPGELIDGGSPATPDAPGELLGGSGAGPGVTISGTLDPDVTGHVPYLGTVGGRPLCTNDGNGIVPSDTAHLRVSYATGRWRIDWYATGGSGPRTSWRANTGTELTPDLASGWAPDAGSDIEPTGAPAIAWSPPPAAPGELIDGGTPATPTAPGSLL